MLKRKKIKLFLSAMVILLMIVNSSMCLTLSGASELSPDFRQLNYVQFLSEMGTAWNLGNTLEANISGTPTETGWGNPMVTKDFISKVKAAGFNSIRIPVSYLSKIGSAPDYTIDAAWLNRIQEVVDYAISQDMYVMLNIHGDGYKTVMGGWLIVDEENQEPIREKYQKVWQQVANKFINYDEHLIFESMNEVFDGDWNDPEPEHYANLNAYNQIFVDTIRQTGGNNSARWLLIPGWNTNIYYTTRDYGFVTPTDTYRSATIPGSEKRIAISVHYYDPWQFCGEENGQISQWGATAADPDRTVSWCQEDHMESQFNDMYEKFVTKGYPFIVGEYGCVDKTKADPANNTYRHIFNKTLCSTIKKYGGVPAYWDNGHNGDYGFAIFDRKTGAVTQQGIVDAVMEALNTTPDFDPNVPPVYVTPGPLPTGTFEVLYESDGGSTVNVTIKSNHNLNVDGWTLEFSFPGDQKITDMWGGTYTQDGSYVTIKNESWNSKIPANGGYVSFGFNISFSETNESPTNFKVNGSSTTKGNDPTPTPIPTPIETQIVGDVNGDKAVDSTDITVLKRYLLKITPDLPVDNDLVAADLNLDNNIDSTDYSILKRYILKIITSLPYVTTP